MPPARPLSPPMPNVGTTQEEPYVYQPPGQLPIPKRHADWTYRWVRLRLPGGAPDVRNVSKKMADGFIPVSFEKLDEVFDNPGVIMKMPSGNVEAGDLGLFSRPAFKTAARNKYYAGVSKAQMRGANQQVQKARMSTPSGADAGELFDNSTTQFVQAKGREVAFSEE